MGTTPMVKPVPSVFPRLIPLLTQVRVDPSTTTVRVPWKCPRAPTVVSATKVRVNALALPGTPMLIAPIKTHSPFKINKTTFELYNTKYTCTYRYPFELLILVVHRWNKQHSNYNTQFWQCIDNALMVLRHNDKKSNIIIIKKKQTRQIIRSKIRS